MATATTDTASSSTALARRQAVESALRRADKVAYLMDEQFELPVVHYRIGLDPIIGVIPAAGDWVTSFAGVYILWQGVRLGVPRRLLWRMAANIAFDLITGYVPGIGDVFDALFKSNMRNARLLHAHFQSLTSSAEPSADTTSKLALYAFGIVTVTALVVIAAIPLLILWFVLHG